jgi:hypothetical protein
VEHTALLRKCRPVFYDERQDFRAHKYTPTGRLHDPDFTGIPSNRRLVAMFSLSVSPFDLPEVLMSSLLRLRCKIQDYGIFSIGAMLAGGLIVLYTARYFTSPYRKLPPGPRGYPIIGNVLELRSTQSWLKFAGWRKKYGQFVLSSNFLDKFLTRTRLGELIYLNAAGQPIVVLNSQRVAVDLLDRRSGIYSDRPRNIVACDIMTKGLFFGLARYGDV